MMKIVRGYLHHAEEFGQEELESHEYGVFLDMIRQNIDFFVAKVPCCCNRGKPHRPGTLP